MLNVTFLGTSAARPTVERNVSSIVIAREGESLMFDCGEGTQRQMMRFGASFSFTDLFITHFHADHILGITGMIRTFGLQGRTDPMRFYGPPGAKDLLRSAIHLGAERIPFEIDIVEIQAGDSLDRGDYDLVVFDTKHTRESVGYALVERERLGRFDPDLARSRGVPEGPLWGKLHRGETVELEDGSKISADDLVGASRPGRTVVYTGDTAPCKSVVEAVAGADLLIHEATFDQDERDRAKHTNHSTASDAAKVALSAGVRRLILTHVSARYSVDARPLLEQAREVFDNTIVAKDGSSFDVPFPDDA
jgi:ribonuclease Z